MQKAANKKEIRTIQRCDNTFQYNTRSQHQYDFFLKCATFSLHSTALLLSRVLFDKGNTKKTKWKRGGISDAIPYMKSMQNVPTFVQVVCNLTNNYAFTLLIFRILFNINVVCTVVWHFQNIFTVLYWMVRRVCNMGSCVSVMRVYDNCYKRVNRYAAYRFHSFRYLLHFSSASFRHFHIQVHCNNNIHKLHVIKLFGSDFDSISPFAWFDSRYHFMNSASE